MRLRRDSETTSCRAGLIGRGAAAVAGVATLRDHSDAVLVAEGEERRDLRHGPRQGDGERAAVEDAAVVAEVRLDIGPRAWRLSRQ